MDHKNGRDLIRYFHKENVLDSKLILIVFGKLYLNVLYYDMSVIKIKDSQDFLSGIFYFLWSYLPFQNGSLHSS